MENKNKNTDELLQILGEKISKTRYIEMRTTEKKNDKIKQVPTNKKMKSIIKAACLLLCVLIGATAITTATSEAFRMKVFGFIFDEQKGYVDIVPSDERQIVKPTYLPKGYKKVSEEEFGTAIEIAYKKDGKEEYLTISEEFGGDYQESIDTETTKREKCLVGEYEAYYFAEIKAKENAMHTLIWQQGSIVIEMSSTLGKKEMVKIGTSFK